MASLAHLLCCHDERCHVHVRVRGLTRGVSYECDLIWSLINRVAVAASPDELSVAREKLESASDSNDRTDPPAWPESKEARQVSMGGGAEATTPSVSEPEQQRALWWDFNGLIRGVCPISSCPQRVLFKSLFDGLADHWVLETREVEKRTVEQKPAQRWTSLMSFRPSVCELVLYSHIRKPRKRKCLKPHSVKFPRVCSQHRTLGTVSA